MFDIRSIRDNPEAFDAALARRGVAKVSAQLVAVDERRRALATEMQVAQAQRNDISKAIGQAMATKDMARAESLKAEVSALKDTLPKLEADEAAVTAELEALLASLPNIPRDDVPAGANEDDNVLIHERGTKPIFAFPAKEHDEIGAQLGMDFESAAAMSGARFVALKGPMARLNRAIGQFMLDMQTTAHGYTEVNPPLLVRDEAVFGTGQLPKFSDDLFQTTNGYWLIPTAEVSVTNLVRAQILDEATLPIRMTALTPCFRSEAGAAGRDTRGLIRQHQFEKVEMVSVTRPEDATEEHERMTGCAEAILDALGLAYRRMLLCTGDMGATAQKTYDIEVWLPGQGGYREISSCSTCGDYQARRMNTRFRPDGEKATRFVHTLNGSGLAVGRTLVAILENYQNSDGSVTIPDVLIPYMAGVTVLHPL
jgi:seryl-tRNA synthetase